MNVYTYIHAYIFRHRTCATAPVHAGRDWPLRLLLISCRKKKVKERKIDGKKERKKTENIDISIY
jgi:hypothetical protein